MSGRRVSRFAVLERAEANHGSRDTIRRAVNCGLKVTRDLRVNWGDADETKWRERFARFGRDYSEDYLVSGWSRAGLNRRLELFHQFINDVLPRDSLVLDLGCGAGTYVRRLTSLGHRVVGLDYSMPSLHRACVADPDRRAAYVAGEAYVLPFVDECFDAVVTIGVLQVLARPERALIEIHRVMRPGGLLILEFLNAFEVVSATTRFVRRILRRAPRVRSYSPNQLRLNLLESGYDIEYRLSIYLPPRVVPWLQPLLRRRGIVRLLDAIPGLPLLTAHAFILASVKRPAAD